MCRASLMRMFREDMPIGSFVLADADAGTVALAADPQTAVRQTKTKTFVYTDTHTHISLLVYSDGRGEGNEVGCLRSSSCARGDATAHGLSPDCEESSSASNTVRTFFLPK